MPYDLSIKSIEKAKPILDFIESQLRVGVQEFVIPIAEPKPRPGFENYAIPSTELQDAMNKAIARCKLLIYQAIASAKKHDIAPYKHWDGIFKYSPVAGGLQLTVKLGTYLEVSDDLMQALIPKKEKTTLSVTVTDANLIESILYINQQAKTADVIYIKLDEHIPLSMSNFRKLSGAIRSLGFVKFESDANSYTYTKGGDSIGTEE